jgi:hypothetical protein
MENGFLVSTQELPEMGTSHKTELMNRLCALTGVNFPEIQRCLVAYQDECARLRKRCCDMEAKYTTLEDLFRRANCPANVLYSDVTIAEVSDDNQVQLTEVVTGLGGDYVDAVPLPPGKLIRLEHLARPGYRPHKIAIDMSLANGGDNYLDFEIQLILVPGGQDGGKPYGPKYRGNQFLNKNGTQIHVPFPPYLGRQLTIGSMERLAVVVKHTGGVNNLNSIYVTLYHDADCAYQACRTPTAAV